MTTPVLLAPFPDKCTIIPRTAPVVIDGVSYQQVVLTVNSTGRRDPVDVAFGAKDGFGIGASANASPASDAVHKATLQAELQRFVDAVLGALP